KVYPNLIKHNPDYPTAAEIRSKSFLGDEDSTHLIKITSREERNAQKPGGRVQYMPDEWPNTPGSDRIVEILLDKNPEPVHIQAWGGGNTAAKAFYKLKTEHPADYESAVSKVIMYNIWYQDDAGNYIETYHPKVTMLYSDAFNTTWAYRIQTHTRDFVTNEVKNNHGPLGALYPQTYISEGDSPSFLYTLFNGLRNYEHPTYGGWGGRFVKHQKFEKVYVDAMDDSDVKKPLNRWVVQANNDFEARLDWCVAEKYTDANHAPRIKFKGKLDRTARPGQTIELNAKGTKDPDGNSVTFKWWQYKDAGTYDGAVTIENATGEKASFTLPENGKQGTIHIILEVADNGKPQLVSYRRFVVTVKDK
ncbi:MAG TPA: nucleoside hydrolase-like domain-containing protein, partial [Flavisolibacter sp.]|nr:nucleoside hydrolase-like domain-containing protein [Flavisolibacter sp.]